MALRRNFIVTNNNHSEEMPFLQSFRQNNFDAREEHLPEIDTGLTTNHNFGSNHQSFPAKNSVDTNANGDVPADLRAAEKGVNSHPKKAQPNQKVDYDDMYFTNEEISVMGYASGDENSSIQLLENREGEIDQHIHKLMPLPDVGTAKPDVLRPHLVISDLPSVTVAPLSPQEDDFTKFKSDSDSRQSRPDDATDLMWRSNVKPHLVGKYNRIDADDDFSERFSKQNVENPLEKHSSEPTELSDLSFSPSTKAQLVNKQVGYNSELLKHSLDFSCRDDLTPSNDLKSEESNESFSDSDEAENTCLTQPVSSGGCNVTKNAGLCGKFLVDVDEPIHMTLEEVRSSLRSLNGYLQSAVQSASSSTSQRESACLRHQKIHKLRGRRMHFGLCLKPRHTGEVAERSFRGSFQEPEQGNGNDHTCVHSKSLKHTLCNWFGIAKCGQSGFSARGPSASDVHLSEQDGVGSGSTISNRALPPVPQRVNESEEDEGDHLEVIVQPDNEQDQPCDDDSLVSPLSPSKTGNNEVMSDFASSIQKVKDCGWYWGPISGEMAEKILSTEPDGSFILRDSSDEYYIFSLTFKLNGFVRHVRIEHEHGNFSFGTFTKFKSHTIVEFIENAVAHSRSGRYLFFIHRRPVLGPMRVQLLHPVSRFKQVQSLQHMCRFTILKVVRRDLIENLPIPKRLKDYLNTPHYYAEQMQEYQNIFTAGSSPLSAPPHVENSNPET